MVAGYATELLPTNFRWPAVRVTDLGTLASIDINIPLEFVDDTHTSQLHAVATVTERDFADVQLLGSFGDALMWAVADEDWPANHERP